MQAIAVRSIGPGSRPISGCLLAPSAFSSSPPANGVVRVLALRSLANSSAESGGALFDQVERIWLATAASSSSLSWANAGIAPVKAVPFTVIWPVMPCSRMLARMRSSPLTHSEPSSGGNTPGNPCPVAWWHATHWAL